MSGAPWVKITLSMGGCIGVGWLLMRAVTPTPEQLYEKMSPDLRRKVDAARAQRLATESAVKRQAGLQSRDPESERPIWADTPPRTS